MKFKHGGERKTGDQQLQYFDKHQFSSSQLIVIFIFRSYFIPINSPYQVIRSHVQSFLKLVKNLILK